MNSQLFGQFPATVVETSPRSQSDTSLSRRLTSPLSSSRQSSLAKSEFALRLPSVLAGIASIFLVFLLGRKTLSEEAGLLAAWCFALHPWFIDQSQDARAYALAICLALLSSIALWRVMERVRIRDAVFLALASAGLIHCQYIFAPFIAYQALFWLWSILRIKNAVKKRLLKFWLATQILYLPSSGSRVSSSLISFGYGAMTFSIR